MGTFVQNLTDTHDEYSAQITIATREKEEALIKMSRVVDELNASKRQDQDTKNKLTALQQEITKLRMLTPSQNISPEKSAQTKTNSPISLHNNFMNARKVLLASQVRNPQRTLLSQPQVSLDANGKTPTSNTSAVPVEPFIKKKTQHLKSAPHISNTSTPSSPTTSSAEKELGFIEVEHKNQE